MQRILTGRIERLGCHSRAAWMAGVGMLDTMAQAARGGRMFSCLPASYRRRKFGRTAAHKACHSNCLRPSTVTIIKATYHDP